MSFASWSPITRGALASHHTTVISWRSALPCPRPRLQRLGKCWIRDCSQGIAGNEHSCSVYLLGTLEPLAFRLIRQFPGVVETRYRTLRTYGEKLRHWTYSVSQKILPPTPIALNMAQLCHT